MKTNRCYKCGKYLPANVDYFHRDKTRKDGLHNCCKICMKEITRQWYKQNPEKIRESHRKWRANNPERIREVSRLWREENRDICRESSRLWREENPEYIKQYRITNPEKVRKWQRDYRNNNPRVFISHAISKSIWKSLRDGKNGRTWESLVGYALDDLMVHLESQFTKDMAWDNYGEWHIDHIRPVTDFQFESYKDLEFKQCWSLWNLQPMWAKDNLSKNNRCTNPPLPLLATKDGT